METLAQCATPSDFAAAQTRFLERMRDDYAEESEVVGTLIASQQEAAAKSVQDGA
jgi:hypothetical protein